MALIWCFFVFSLFVSFKSEANKDLSCASCHQTQTLAWKSSHHFHSMAEVSSDSNLGDFTLGKVKLNDEEIKLLIQDDKYLITMPGVDGSPVTKELLYTFGYYPLQQYMFSDGAGKYQFIPYAWDSRSKAEGGQRWFNLYPELNAEDEFHWTQMGQNWNQNCADCHSTNFKKGFDLETLSYQSSYDVINVSCSACHQGSEQHLTWVKNPDSKIKNPDSNKNKFGFSQDISTKVPAFATNDLGKLFPTTRVKKTQQVEVCAQCHSRRSQLSDHTESVPYHQQYQSSLVNTPLYYPDGQIFDEVYVYGSFKQSKMYQNGVTCTNCHDPHTLKLKHEGNATCTQCHSAEQYDIRSHHQHLANSAGSQCVNCHMPETTYMEVDDRRDHSFKVPRPDLSVTLGVPNACQSCHSDIANDQHAKQLTKWFPNSTYQKEKGYAHAFALADSGDFTAIPALMAIANVPTNPELIRASAVSRIFGARNNRELIGFISKQLNSSDIMLVLAAIRASGQLSLINRSLKLIPLLTHQEKPVRMAAGRQLVENLADPTFVGEKRQQLEKAVAEYIEGQLYQADRATAHVNSGQVYALKRDFKQAEEALLTAIKVEDIFMPAYVYLAEVYRQQGDEFKVEKILKQGLEVNNKAADLYFQLALSKVRQKNKQAALPLFDKAVANEARNPRYLYTRAVLLQENQQLQAAKADYGLAHQIVPNNPDYLYGLVSVLISLKSFDEALHYAYQLNQLVPNNQQVQQLIQFIRYSNR